MEEILTWFHFFFFFLQNSCKKLFFPRSFRPILAYVFSDLGRKNHRKVGSLVGNKNYKSWKILHEFFDKFEHLNRKLAIFINNDEKMSTRYFAHTNPFNLQFQFLRNNIILIITMIIKYLSFLVFFYIPVSALKFHVRTDKSFGFKRALNTRISYITRSSIPMKFLYTE